MEVYSSKCILQDKQLISELYQDHGHDFESMVAALKLIMTGRSWRYICGLCMWWNVCVHHVWATFILVIDLSYIVVYVCFIVKCYVVWYSSFQCVILSIDSFLFHVRKRIWWWTKLVRCCQMFKAENAKKKYWRKKT